MNECFMGCSPVAGGGGERFYVSVYPELTVYGHTIDAFTRERYPEDWPHTQDLRQQGIEWGCWHSVLCPEGEIGSAGAQTLRESSYEQFVEAREKDWPELSELTVPPGTPIVAVYTPDESGELVKSWDSLSGDA